MVLIGEKKRNKVIAFPCCTLIRLSPPRPKPRSYTQAKEKRSKVKEEREKGKVLSRLEKAISG